MDFRSLIAARGALAGVNADALVVVVAGELRQQALDKPLADALQDAVNQGDLQWKPGRTLYLHRPSGVKVSVDGVAVIWLPAATVTVTFAVGLLARRTV